MSQNAIKPKWWRIRTELPLRRVDKSQPVASDALLQQQSITKHTTCRLRKTLTLNGFAAS